MQKRRREAVATAQRHIRLAAVCLSCLLLFGCIPQARVQRGVCLESVDEAEIQTLIALGFPRSYAEALLPLTRLHPNWTFEPLLVPESWETVLDFEVEEDPARNLVSSGSFYTPYRHESNAEQYDTAYYQASRAAVAYFMDARNFFNEADVFQFYCLSNEGDESDVRGAITSVLNGTFMQDAMVDAQTSYVDAFVQVGKQTGVNAVYLAVKARQEQGLTGSATVQGCVGDRLIQLMQSGQAETELIASELLEYNGLYNIYNVSASGNGTFSVLLSAMNRAQKGTPEFEASWGGSPAWDSVYKSILGGAMTMKARYVDNDQDTIYLQKFNVSPDSSRRFWGQYMQNVVGALSEGRAIFHAFAAADVIDRHCHFRIPVYTDMPDEPCPDPANGSCAYAAVSTNTYPYEVQLKIGKLKQAENDQAIRLSLTLCSDGPLLLNGTLLLSGGALAVEWRLIQKNGEALSEQPWQAANSLKCKGDKTSFKIVVSEEQLAELSQNDTLTIALRAKPTYASGSGQDVTLRCQYVLLSYIDLTGAEKPQE